MNTPATQSGGSLKPVGSESDALIIAFVQGAAWWEYHQTKATMWGSDRERAEIEARWKLAHGSLGKPFPNAKCSHGAENPKA
jgi:hypothetical protein